jgi:hypothetical protein
VSVHALRCPSPLGTRLRFFHVPALEGHEADRQASGLDLNVEECGEHGRDSATHGRSGASGARETGPEGHDRVFAPDERANFSDSCFSLMPWFTATSVKAPPRSGSITSAEKGTKVLMSNSCL